MAFQVSPGINTSEVDLTTIVPTVSTTAGAIGGLFRWGPVNNTQVVSSETDLINRYGYPTNYNAETWFTAANFLAYGNQLWVSRGANTTDTTLNGNGSWTAVVDSSNSVANSVANGTYTGANVSTIFNILNTDDYLTKYNAGSFAGQPNYLYAAQYPGALGSSLAISLVDTPTAFSSNLVNIANTTFTPSSNVVVFGFNDNSATINAATTAANMASYVAWNSLTNGDFLTIGNSSIGYQYIQVTSKGNAPVFVANVGTVTSSNITITSLSSTANVSVGMVVTANVSGFANGVTVVAVVNSTAVNVSSQFTGSTSSANIHFAQETLSLNLASNYSLTPSSLSLSGNVGRLWQFYSSVTAAPGTSPWVSQYGNSSAIDEMHLVIYDKLGTITGSAGQPLEVFQGISRATDAQTLDGSNNYYIGILNNVSKWAWWTNHRGGSSYVANSLAISTLTSATYLTPLSVQFAGGQDGFTESAVGNNIGVITNAYDQFKSTEGGNVSLIMAGKADDTNQVQLANYIIQNIANVRKDCVAFVSPHKATVVSNFGGERSAITTFRNSLVSTSYAVMDSGYKYQYDKYNDIYRYVPLNGDIAGLCVNTDTVRDPWWSPAGFNRGQIKNIVKLAYNPNKTDRDILYPISVNPVVTFPGQGTILYGDKTLLAKPSAFDRINVRRLFIVLEKAIATAAQYSLFEFNDEFTRAQFVSLVTPFLKDVQGRRGIYDFKVVCDTTNNTGQVIDANQFVGDIYVKPARSINYIQLNFVAVRTGVDFAEIVGRF